MDKYRICLPPFISLQCQGPGLHHLEHHPPLLVVVPESGLGSSPWQLWVTAWCQDASCHGQPRGSVKLVVRSGSCWLVAFVGCGLRCFAPKCQRSCPPVVLMHLRCVSSLFIRDLCVQIHTKH